MVYEKEVTSFDDLMKAVRALDQDSGIRMLGKSGARDCLVFVTRFDRRFTMMIFGVNARARTPGRRLSVTDFDSLEALAEALRKVAAGPLRAYVY